MATRSGRLQRFSVTAALAVTLGAVLSLPAPNAVASPHDASPTVTTCAALGVGSTGAAVKTIQNHLGATADGDFGPATEKAVKQWQKLHKIPVTGVVDAATWAALSSRTAAKACGQQVAGSGVTPTCASLTTGATGVAVGVLQKALGTSVDRDFGGGTLAALKAAQTAAKLTATGITDARTWKALHLLGTPVCSTTASTGPQPPSDEKAQAKVRAHVVALAAKLVKKPGTTTNKVALQAIAFAKSQLGKPYIYGGIGPKGYDCSGLQMTSYLHAGLSIPRVAAAQYAGAGKPESLLDAKAGDLLFYASDVTKPATVYHVVMYIGGGQVISAPETGQNVKIQPLWTTDLLPTVVRPVANLTLPVKPGATGYTVTQLQQDLNRHGAGLTVDGGYGATTQAAVKAWQQKQKLKPNVVVHTQTWLTLG